MIELSFDLGNTCDIFKAVQFFNNLYVWLLAELSKHEKSNEWVKGFLIMHDVASNTVGSLFLTTPESPEADILKLIQQPPGEFNGKYTAHIVAKEEPTVVQEQPPGVDVNSLVGVKRGRNEEEEEEELTPMKMEIDET